MDWLDRMRDAAYSASDIATVTALGEQASIASYPPAGARRVTQDASMVDAIAREVNRGVRVGVPVGVGFCLLPETFVSGPDRVSRRSTLRARLWRGKRFLHARTRMRLATYCRR